MTITAPEFTPQQPGSIPAPAPCAICGSPGHHTLVHDLTVRLDRQVELLSVMAGILSPKVYRLDQQSVAASDGSQRLTLVFESWPGGVNKLWLVERVTWSIVPSGAQVLKAYAMEGLPGPVTLGPANQLNAPALDATGGNAARNMVWAPAVAASFGSADLPKPFVVKGSEKLIFQFASVGANDSGVVHIQYREAWQSQD